MGLETDGVMQFRRAKTLRKIVKCKLFRRDVKNGAKGRTLHRQSNMHFQLINALMQRKPRDWSTNTERPRQCVICITVPVPLQSTQDHMHIIRTIHIGRHKQRVMSACIHSPDSRGHVLTNEQVGYQQTRNSMTMQFNHVKQWQQPHSYISNYNQ